MDWDLKSIADLIAAVATLIAAIVAAVQAAQAKKEVEEIRTEIRTEIKATLAMVLQNTQILGQTQQVHIHMPGATAGQSIAVPEAIFQHEQEEPPERQEGQQGPQENEPQG